MRRITAVLVSTVVAVAALAPVAARADHQLLHTRPQKAAPGHFPTGFAVPTDSEWGFPLGGFGGPCTGAAEEADHEPVILVHGNLVDHADWYPVQDDLRAAGWTDCDIWALSYNGLGNGSGSAGGTTNPRRDEEHLAEGADNVPHHTADEINVADLVSFIHAVLAYTGDERFSIAGHSLGVTLARRALETRPRLAARLVAFVGIAGANHGTSLCTPGSEGRVHGCDEIAAGTPWLAALNAAPDEFGTAAVMTVYDGTGAGDVAFTGPAYADSPRLGDVVAGALDCTYPARGHNDLRLDPAIVDAYRAFIEAAERGTPLDTCPADPLGLR